jgi:hypothetical protein
MCRRSLDVRGPGPPLLLEGVFGSSKGAALLRVLKWKQQYSGQHRQQRQHTAPRSCTAAAPSCSSPLVILAACTPISLVCKLKSGVSYHRAACDGYQMRLCCRLEDLQCPMLAPSKFGCAWNVSTVDKPLQCHGRATCKQDPKSFLWDFGRTQFKNSPQTRFGQGKTAQACLHAGNSRDASQT